MSARATNEQPGRVLQAVGQDRVGLQRMKKFLICYGNIGRREATIGSFSKGKMDSERSLEGKLRLCLNTGVS